jgi:deoxyribodipyrimidine photo-lyase
MVHKERIQHLNHQDINRQGSFVLYWMQSSQRVEKNQALEYAIMKANELQKPLIVFFGLTEEFPEANERHYTFMLEGLQEVQRALSKKGVQFIIQLTSPEKGIQKLAKEASLVIVDRGYLRLERKWRQYVAGRIDCSLVQIEDNVIVPVEISSDKAEYAAYTIRPKINRKLDTFLQPTFKEREPRLSSFDYQFASLELGNIKEVLDKTTIDSSVPKVKTFTGGTSRAKGLLRKFIDNKLDSYAEKRNDPSVDYLSHMSPYLHFGQISPLFIALEVGKVSSPGKESYLEELIIRRELSMNFIFYTLNYDKYPTILPEWAKTTLEQHSTDTREYIYTLEELEQAKTHDPYWNAAQNEMRITGKMHGYMRMYWGKKIIEWTENPQLAFHSALQLNNKYELDGRDANAYAGVAWCFGKHDRAWKERPIFGKVRYMNARGLERKFDIKNYVKKIEKLDNPF